jgi:GntR family transcriptional regulator, transcriptional repressor for pyruvate dehydrogenase complex
MRSTLADRSPEALADRLLVRIFRGELAAGSRLPPERHFAEELGVDRTSLRMALKQLQRMGVLVARHGSGIEVRDYRVDGGLEFLAAIFSQPDIPLEGTLVVEALDFWLEIFSTTGAKAFVRMSLDDVRTAEHLLDLDRFSDAIVETTDLLARLSGSVLFRMLNNSTRPLVRRMARLLPGTADVTTWLRATKTLLRTAALARAPEELVRSGLLGALRVLTGDLREQLLVGGDTPRGKKKSARA